MIEFDLERALAGDKVVTRDGRKVTQLMTFDCAKDEGVLYGVIDMRSVDTWTNGGYYQRKRAHHPSDLFMAPKMLSGFINVYSNGRHSNVHKTKLAADEWAEDMPSDSIRLKCIDLSQFEVEHGL